MMDFKDEFSTSANQPNSFNQSNLPNSFNQSNQPNLPNQFNQSILPDQLSQSNQLSQPNQPPVPMVGRTNRKVFWGVMLAATVLLGFLFSGVSSGLIALAANLPIPFTITAKSLTGTNFHLYPGISSADGTTPVVVNTLDGSLTDQVISKSFQILGKTITLKLSAGGGKTPVTVTGLVTDISALSADSAHFQNLVLSTNPGLGAGLDQKATSVTLTNLNISSPYLSANTITLPNLTISLTMS